jgi:hypothetical protein
LEAESASTATTHHIEEDRGIDIHSLASTEAAHATAKHVSGIFKINSRIVALAFPE